MKTQYNTFTMKTQDNALQNQQKLNRIKEELFKYREAKKNNENHFLPQQRMQDNAPQSCKEFNRRKQDDKQSSFEMKQQLISKNQQEIAIQREITLADLQNFEVERQSIELANENWKQALMMQETEAAESEELTFEGLRIKHLDSSAGLKRISDQDTKEICQEGEQKKKKIQTNSSQFRSPQAHGNLIINNGRYSSGCKGQNGNNLEIDNLLKGNIVCDAKKNEQINPSSCVSTKRRLNHLSLQISGEMGCQTTTTATSNNSNNPMIQMSQCSTGLISCRNPQETEKEQIQQMSLLSSANTLQSLGSQKFQLLLNSSECIPCNQLHTPTPMDYTLDSKNTSFKLNQVQSTNVATAVDQGKKQIIAKSLATSSKAYSSCNSTPKQQSVQKKISLISEKSENSTKNSDRQYLHFASSNQKQSAILHNPANCSTTNQSNKNSSFRTTKNIINASFISKKDSYQTNNINNVKNSSSPVKSNLNHFSCKNSSNYSAAGSNRANTSNLQSSNTKKEISTTKTKSILQKNHLEPYFKSARAQEISHSFRCPSSQYEKLSELQKQKDNLREEHQPSEQSDSKSNAQKPISVEEENWREEQKEWRIFGSQMIKAYEQLSEDFNKVISEKRKQEMDIKQAENTHCTYGNKNNSSAKEINKLNASCLRNTSNPAQTNPTGVSESLARLQQSLCRNQFPGALHEDLQIVLAELERVNSSNKQLMEKCSQVETAVEAHLNQSSQLAGHVIHLRTQLDKASTRPVQTPQDKCQSDCRTSHISSSSKTVRDRIQDVHNIHSSDFQLAFPSQVALLLPQQEQRQQQHSNQQFHPYLPLSLGHSSLHLAGITHQTERKNQQNSQHQLDKSLSAYP